jgi:hypothetical protein
MDLGSRVIGDEWTSMDNKSACLALDELMVSQLFPLLELAISVRIFEGMGDTIFSITSDR